MRVIILRKQVLGEMPEETSVEVNPLELASKIKNATFDLAFSVASGVADEALGKIREVENSLDQLEGWVITHCTDPDLSAIQPSIDGESLKRKSVASLVSELDSEAGRLYDLMPESHGTLGEMGELESFRVLQEFDVPDEEFEVRQEELLEMPLEERKKEHCRAILSKIRKMRVLLEELEQRLTVGEVVEARLRSLR
jgi:hypothetical protein